MKNYNVNNVPPPIVTIVKEWKGEGAPPPPVEELSLEELESLAASLQRVDSGKAGAISQGMNSSSDARIKTRVNYCEIIADNVSKAGWSWGCVSAVDSSGRTIWIADAHRRDGIS
jgi:hypothetical protein